MSIDRSQPKSRRRTTAVVAKLVAIIAMTFAFAAFGGRPQNRADGARAVANDHAPTSTFIKDRQ